jgi:aminoglycoside phosphotransferase (APT) family kinase protein
MHSELSTNFADDGIPTLECVLDPSALRRHVFPLLPQPWGEVSSFQIQVLQHHQGRRCTVNIILQTADGHHEVVGKIYAEDRADVYRAMKEISRSGFGPEKELSIPQPLAYVPELHLLLQEKVTGQSVTEIFIKGSERERVAAAERCARWLARFHLQGPRSDTPFVISRELMELWARRLVKRAGLQAKPLADKAKLLVERLARTAAALQHAEMCAGHGGYYHSQIISTQNRTVTFDWDNHCVADPSRDVARFIFMLQQLALQSLDSPKALDAACSAFYKTYTVASRFEVTHNIPFYKAAHCLKHARYHLKQDVGGFEKNEALLDEGLRVLAEEM